MSKNTQHVIGPGRSLENALEVKVVLGIVSQLLRAKIPGDKIGVIVLCKLLPFLYHHLSQWMSKLTSV